ncbi:synaptonemal complex protein 1 [Rhineura floridana]|uniref:synaptonemal complex protein 1 n=1 Tax=Rhineura floridana TaxID=261503 RepID=UPI002AC7F98A|nr:synaptonemal complex protein 1 [Rhineura floridana]
MEQEKSFKFKLFVPPRLSNTQISAVKPQTNTRDGGLFQDFSKGTEDDCNLPFGVKSMSKHTEVIEPVSPKVKLVSKIDQENMETMNELYSRLYKEAEKIKRWKINIEYEVKEKERKLQENRKIIEALRKAIQELQFENEKLSLKLEDEIRENKDLLQENSATRHLCNLLKERCMQLLEKSNKYEHEQEETRQMYVDLNNNIERMIQAFEELRAQAERSRLELHVKLKEEAEKTTELEKEYKREINAMEKQVSELAVQNGEKDNKMKHLNIQLQESRELIDELEEIKKQHDEVLKKAQSKQEGLLTELEETKSSLQNAENSCKSLETELQTAVKTLIQVTEQKEVTVEELKEFKEKSASVIDDLQTKVSNLKEQLEKEERRQKELRDESDILVLELQKKSAELEVMAKVKNDKEKQIEEMEKSLVLLDEKQILEKNIEKLQERENELKDSVQIREMQSPQVSAISQNTMDQYVGHETNPSCSPNPFDVARGRCCDDTSYGEESPFAEHADGDEWSDSSEHKEDTSYHLFNGSDYQPLARRLAVPGIDEPIANLVLRSLLPTEGESQLKDATERKLDFALRKNHEATAFSMRASASALKNEQLGLEWNRLLLDKEHIATEKNNIVAEFKKLQEDLKTHAQVTVAPQRNVCRQPEDLGHYVHNEADPSCSPNPFDIARGRFVDDVSCGEDPPYAMQAEGDDWSDQSEQEEDTSYRLFDTSDYQPLARRRSTTFQCQTLLLSWPRTNGLTHYKHAVSTPLRTSFTLWLLSSPTNWPSLA